MAGITSTVVTVSGTTTINHDEADSMSKGYQHFSITGVAKKLCRKMS